MQEDRAECWDLARWNAATARAFDDVAVDSPARRFHARLASRRFGGVQLVQVDSSGARVRGGRRGTRPGWYVLYSDEGRCAVRQAGREARLADGELSLVRADRPFDIDFDDHHSMTVVALPPGPGTAPLGGHLALRHGAAEAAVFAALLQGLLHLDEARAECLAGPQVQRAVVDLLAVATPAIPAGGERHAALGAQLQALVAREAAQPGLDAHALARELGISLRYVQWLFARDGTTATAAILEQRLQLAAARLRAAPAETVLDVAMACGFGDLSHFCRCFKRRFGRTASAWRGAV